VVTLIDGKWPVNFFERKIDGFTQIKEYSLCLGIEMDIQKRVSLSRNGYLFSKDNALDMVFILRFLCATFGNKNHKLEIIHHS